MAFCITALSVVLFLTSFLGDVGSEHVRSALGFVPEDALIKNTYWTECPVHSNFGPFWRNETVVAHCATIPVSLHHTEESDTINIFVKRFSYHIEDDDEDKQFGDEKESNVWLLPGPRAGETMASVESVLSHLVHRSKGSIIGYTMDPRGTGYSHRLGCVWNQAESPGSPGGSRIVSSEWAPCLERWGEGLYDYSLDALARDVLSVMATIQMKTIDGSLKDTLKNDDDEDEDVESHYLTGVGFSTLIIQRALQIYESEHLKDALTLSGVLLDSVLPIASEKPHQENIKEDTNLHATTTDESLKRFVIEDSILRTENVGREILARCANDASCASHFKREPHFIQEDPNEVLDEVFVSVFNQTSCPEILEDLNEVQFREFLGWLTLSFHRWPLVPVVVYRLRRCNEVAQGDVSTLRHLIHVWRTTSHIRASGTHPSLESPLFEHHLIYNEMLSDPPVDPSEIEKRLEEVQFAPADIRTLLHDAKDWTTNPKSTFANQLPVRPSHVKALIFASDLDSTSPLDQSQALHRLWTKESHQQGDAPSVQLVTFNNVEGFALRHALKKNDKESCGIIILEQFVTQKGVLDTSCAADLLRTPSFDGEPSSNIALMGVENIWEGIYTGADETPMVSLWLFVGTTTALVFFFTSLIAIITYVAILFYIRSKTSTQKSEEESEEFFPPYEQASMYDME